MNEYNLPIYELVIENDNELGVYCIGLVSNPAIETNWITLSKQYLQLKTVDDKKLLIGPALIPDKKIYRVDNTGKEYYVTFSKDTIEKIVKKYFKQSQHVNFNMEHVENLTINAVVQESWIIEDSEKDKSAIYGFNLPVGTWMLATYIEDDNVWNDFVKTEKLKGYSIEGMFSEQLIKASEEKLVIEPNARESENEFISRCISYEVGNGIEQEQAIAICYSKWDNAQMSKQSLTEQEALKFIKSLINRYGK